MGPTLDFGKAYGVILPLLERLSLSMYLLSNLKDGLVFDHLQRSKEYRSPDLHLRRPLNDWEMEEVSSLLVYVWMATDWRLGKILIVGSGSQTIQGVFQ